MGERTFMQGEMYGGKTVAVVVPAYNEEGLVGQVLDSIPEFVDRVYAVDDCSTDGTWVEIQKQAGRSVDESATPSPSSSPSTSSAPSPDGGVVDISDTQSASAGSTQTQSRIVPLRHETNQGVGASIKTGYKQAIQDRMDVVAVINGDGQMDPDILDRFVEPIVKGDADYTKGNRLCARELHTDMPLWRFTGNAILTFLTKVASGYWKVNDPQNGYTAIGLEALEALELDTLYDRYGFLNDVLIQLNVQGFRVSDVPMEAVYGDEESGIRYSSFIPRLSMLLLQGFIWRLKVKYFILDFHPLVLFYLLGTGGIVSGTGYALWASVTSRDAVLTGGLTILILLVSAGLLVFAMVFDMRHNEHLEETLDPEPQ